ncbi:MAG TPA: uroporphyrinogen-III synthase [Rhodanobacteraceae bacterium]|nr:uroporphyrinogen-III synthase [Rhodanobacteraceae bacterium]
MSSRSGKPLTGARVAITRPVGAGAALRKRVRALGGIPLSLPGSSLRATDDPGTARAALREGLSGDVVIFTSPAAVRFAARLLPLRTRAVVVAPGAGTATALRRVADLDAMTPARADSEGMLTLAQLQRVRGKRVCIVGAPGGRGLLESTLRKRGAHVVLAQVYQRVPARLDRRHTLPLSRNRAPLYVPLSSSEALRTLLVALPEESTCALLAGVAIASSERLLQSAREAGFARVLRAESANDADLIAAILDAHARQ